MGDTDSDPIDMDTNYSDPFSGNYSFDDMGEVFQSPFIYLHVRILFMILYGIVFGLCFFGKSTITLLFFMSVSMTSISVSQSYSLYFIVTS